MSVTYVRNDQGVFERVGPGGATTDTTLSQVGKPADAAAVGSALAGYATEAYVSSQVNTKVDKVDGQGLSTNDYTTAEKTKLAGIATGANKTVVDSALSSSSTNPVQNKVINTALGNKADASHTHTASAVGALPYIDARSADYDMDAILSGGTHYNTYRYNNTTLGTPYAKGVSEYSSGLIISTAVSTGSGKQVAYANGENCNYERTMQDGVIGDWCATYNSGHKPSLSDLGAAAAKHTHNVFSSLTEIGITTFPTTMYKVCTSMPKNSMIVIDTRVINGTHDTYSTETISDWGTTLNGIAIIAKGFTSARMTMLIMYGTSTATDAQLVYGNYAYESDVVNWDDLDDQLDAKVDKITTKAAVDLNTLTEPGLYYVSSGTTDLNFPIGVNGHLLVMSDGDNRVRQVFMRLGTANTNNFQWYSRTLHTSTWSNWWLISGQEKIWNGGAVLNDEINIGSRYGCQSWIVVARLQNTGALSSVVIPRAFLTNDTDLYKFQIADETCFISFYIYYKSDNDVYLKVVDQSDNEYTTLKYVYRTT